MTFIDEYAPMIGLAIIVVSFGSMIFIAKKQQKQAKNNIKTA